jgi:hypothetical protein
MPGAYWPQPWTCEDGGPLRRCCADGVPGLGLRPGERLEVAASIDAFATDVLVRREPGELYALRHDMPVRRPLATPVEGWVERLDPETLAVAGSTPRLPGGTYWPGGMAAHASGDLHMVFGRWAHRLSPELEVLASHRLPVPRPHNSFVVLSTGELVMKDCDAPAGLEPLWRRDGFAHAGHLIVFPDTRELVAQDWKDRPALRRPIVRRALRPGFQVLAGSAFARRASLRTGSDQLVVLDLDTGADKARVDVPSPSQGFLFPAPGFNRDVYYQSLTTIARVGVSVSQAG